MVGNLLMLYSKNNGKGARQTSPLSLNPFRAKNIFKKNKTAFAFFYQFSALKWRRWLKLLLGYDMATQGAMASAAMGLIYFVRNIPVSSIGEGVDHEHWWHTNKLYLFHKWDHWCIVASMHQWSPKGISLYPEGMTVCRALVLIHFNLP